MDESNKARASAAGSATPGARYLTWSAAAQLLGVSSRTLRRRHAIGEFPEPVPVPGLRGKRFRHEDLAPWLAPELRVPASEPAAKLAGLLRELAECRRRASALSQRLAQIGRAAAAAQEHPASGPVDERRAPATSASTSVDGEAAP